MLSSAASRRWQSLFNSKAQPELYYWPAALQQSMKGILHDKSIEFFDVPTEAVIRYGF